MGDILIMYTINDIYGYLKFDFLNKIIDRALKKLKLKNVVFSIILVDDITMKDLNNNYRHLNKTTDVLSFALEDNDKNVNYDLRLLGDVYISIPQMIKQANEFKHGEEKELSFLVVHGLLHLLGYDHIDEVDEKDMFDLQEEIINENE